MGRKKNQMDYDFFFCVRLKESYMTPVKKENRENEPQRRRQHRRTAFDVRVWGENIQMNPAGTDLPSSLRIYCLCLAVRFADSLTRRFS